MRIGVDIDEVLAPFLKTMVQSKNLKLPAMKKYPYVYSTMFGMSQRESSKMVDEFYRTEEFRRMRPIHGSQVTLRVLQNKGHEIYAITGRQAIAEDVTFDWLEEHFPKTFTDCYLTNSFTQYETDKSVIANQLGLGLMIDDSLYTCQECEASGISSVQFIGSPVYPWCKDDQHVMTVGNWKEISEIFVYET